MWWGTPDRFLALRDSMEAAQGRKIPVNELMTMLLDTFDGSRSWSSRYVEVVVRDERTAESWVETSWGRPHSAS